MFAQNSSLHNLLNTKSNESDNRIDPTRNCTKSNVDQQGTYSNELNDRNENKQPIYYKILHLGDKNQSRKPLKKLDRKINKDDIKIANDIDVKVFKHAVKPAPPSEIKPNVTIVKAGLTSTTNEMVANMNTKNRSRLHSIKNDGN